MTSLRRSRDVIDDVIVGTTADDYAAAAEKLRLELTPVRAAAADDGVTRLRPPPPPLCAYTGPGGVDLVAASTPIYCPSSRRLAPPPALRSTEYVFSAAPCNSRPPAADSPFIRTCVQLAYETPPARQHPQPAPAAAGAAPADAKPARLDAQRRALSSFGVAST